MFKARQVHKVIQGLVLRVQPVPRADKVTQGLRAVRVTQVQAPQELLAHRVVKAIRVRKAQPAHRALRGILELKDLQGLRAILEFKD